MYSKIEELPTEVRNSFDAEDAKRWMDEYNKLSKDDDTDTARIKAWRACMNLPSSFSFKIMASVEDVDAEGELITLDTIRDNLDSYIREGGKVQQAHSNYQIATIWDYEDAICPETGKPGIAVYGNVFGGDGDNIEYTKAREDFKNGQNSLSVGGDASYEGYECNEDQCFVRRNMEELMEISLCHTPANPYAKLIWYNDKAVVKSKDDVALKVTDVEVHKSYDECSYMAVARMIQKATDTPIAYRTSHFGCAVKTEDETGLMDVMDSLRLHYDYDIKKGEFIVRSLEDELHRVFKKGMKEGWLNPDYTIGDCSAPYFLSMVDRGLIVKADSERWKLNADILKDGGAMTAGNAGSSGAFNARYSDRDKAIITFEGIMDWRSRITKSRTSQDYEESQRGFRPVIQLDP